MRGGGVDMYLFSLGSESPKGAIGHIIPTEKSVLAVERNKVLLPPLWNWTLSWGFDDFSCCLGNYGSDKVTEHCRRVALLSGWGGSEIGQPLSPTSSVWLMPPEKKRAELTLSWACLSQSSPTLSIMAAVSASSCHGVTKTLNLKDVQRLLHLLTST